MDWWSRAKRPRASDPRPDSRRVLRPCQRLMPLCAPMKVGMERSGVTIRSASYSYGSKLRKQSERSSCSYNFQSNTLLTASMKNYSQVQRKGVVGALWPSAFSANVARSDLHSTCNIPVICTLHIDIRDSIAMQAADCVHGRRSADCEGLHLFPSTAARSAALLFVQSVSRYFVRSGTSLVYS